jgi:hypothetical protein
MEVFVGFWKSFFQANLRLPPFKILVLSLKKALVLKTLTFLTAAGNRAGFGCFFGGLL